MRQKVSKLIFIICCPRIQATRTVALLLHPDIAADVADCGCCELVTADFEFLIQNPRSDFNAFQSNKPVFDCNMGVPHDPLPLPIKQLAKGFPTFRYALYDCPISGMNDNQLALPDFE
jgi:hypothetical protein